MRTAGRAYMAGFFGCLGAATAIGITGVTLVLIGERKVKRILSEFEEWARNQTDTILRAEEPPDDI